MGGLFVSLRVRKASALRYWRFRISHGSGGLGPSQKTNRGRKLTESFSCHSEPKAKSLSLHGKMLRCAQHDSITEEN